MLTKHSHKVLGLYHVYYSSLDWNESESYVVKSTVHDDFKWSEKE